MISIGLANGNVIKTNDGDLSFWAQRMSTTDIQLIKEKTTGTLMAINPKYIVAVAENVD